MLQKKFVSFFIFFLNMTVGKLIAEHSASTVTALTQAFLRLF